MEPEARGPRSTAKLVLLLALALVAGAGFFALGVWQVQRLAWKHDLIARVERNVHGAPVPVPPPAEWTQLTRDDEYRRMQAHGRMAYESQVLVAATTDLGAGYWVLTPMRTEEGSWILVNRGFVPPEMRERVPQGALEQTVTGLLRFTEPRGRLWQDNDPQSGRWYSRDVEAIAEMRGLTGPIAPFFLDEVATPGVTPAWPRPGLTVIRFANNHLEYAITWFALGAMMIAAFVYVLLDDRRRRRAA
jgi:surfeit locus 1 family protein